MKLCVVKNRKPHAVARSLTSQEGNFEHLRWIYGIEPVRARDNLRSLASYTVAHRSCAVSLSKRPSTGSGSTFDRFSDRRSVFPGVLRLVAQHPPRLLDREQRLGARHLARKLHARKPVRSEFDARRAHHRVGGRDDEPVEPGRRVLERLEHGLRAVAGVDVAPRVPAAQRDVILKFFESG